MPRIGIFGGGIAGLAAAFECEQRRRAGVPLDWFLYEASDRFGGTLSTTRLHTPDGEYILEDGPDGWLTEKPWAAELALELGLADEMIPCREADRRTLIHFGGTLIAMPDRMRLIVPEDLAALEDSPLFTASGKQAYAEEILRAEELRHRAPTQDESVASFVRRHFGPEVLERVAAPLLAGVFGGDVERLSVRAVMPSFVAMERDAGSLIASLQARARMRGQRPPQPTFTSLRRGMGTLAEALVAALPPERLLREHTVTNLERTTDGWLVRLQGAQVNTCVAGLIPFDHVFLATPAQVTAGLLSPLDPEAAGLLPQHASSALLVTLCWPPDRARSWALPQGFGFLVPPDPNAAQPELLAATFAEQKYPHRAPSGAHIVRVFFGDRGAAALAGASSPECAQAATAALTRAVGPLSGAMPEPDPTLTTIRRWPRSLPQYETGHLDRIAELQSRVEDLGRLHLLGNALHGVGVPDLIRDARAAVRAVALRPQS